MYLLFVIHLIFLAIRVIHLNCVIFSDCPECRCFCGRPIFGYFCHVSIICHSPECVCYFCDSPELCNIFQLSWISLFLCHTNILFLFVMYLFFVIHLNVGVIVNYQYFVYFCHVSIYCLLRRITRIVSFHSYTNISSFFLMYLYIVYHQFLVILWLTCHIPS